MTEGNNVAHFLTLMCSCNLTLVHLRCALPTIEFPLGISETFLSSMLVHSSRTVPPPGALLQLQVSFVLIPISSNGQLSHWFRLYTIIKCNLLNAELHSMCHLLALLGTHHNLHVSRLRVNILKCPHVVRIRLFLLVFISFMSCFMSFVSILVFVVPSRLRCPWIFSQQVTNKNLIDWNWIELLLLVVVVLVPEAIFLHLCKQYSSHLQTCPGAHSAPYTMGTGSFPGVMRPGRGAEHPI